jgi:hypothetical protein
MDEKLPTDDYSKALRQAQGNPAAIEKTSMIDLVDFLGNAETWIVKTIRLDGHDVVFLQRVNAGGSLRCVLPFEVTDAIARQRDAAVTVGRRRGAHKAAATRRAKR